MSENEKMYLYEVTIRSVIDDDSEEENHECHVETHEAYSPRDAALAALENWRESCYPNYDEEVIQVNLVLYQKYPGDSDENEPYPAEIPESNDVECQNYEEE